MASRNAEAGAVDLVLVGTSTPFGAEVKRRLSEERLDVSRTVLAEVDPRDDEGGRLLSEFAGEALLVAPIEEVEFGRARLAVLLDAPERTAPWLDCARQAHTCLDCSGASVDRGDATWVYGRIVEGSLSGPLAAPRPVAATLVDLLEPLAGALRAASATVLLPASSVGGNAVEELYQQTRNLLSFHDLPRKELGRQLAFNVLPWEESTRPGSGALAGALAREVRFLLGDDAPSIDLQLLLTSTFHGYGYSLRVEAPGLTAGEIATRLEGGGVRVLTRPEEPASPVEALQSEHPVVVSRLAPAGEGTFWLWAVADSLGAGAGESVVRVARQLLTSAPRPR